MKIINVAAAVLLRPDGSFLLGQRAADTFYAGYWEFPGGKVEPGETPAQALVRELEEELGIYVVQSSPWLVREHRYEHAHVRLHFFRVTEWHGELRDHVHAALCWQAPDALSVTPMLPANASILRALALPSRYGITQAAHLGIEAQLAALDRALAGGLRLVQVREAALPPEDRERFARAVVDRCHRQGARVLVNADAALAHAAGADGIHLPSGMLATIGTRPEFGLVAASCHDAGELELAARLELDFVVLGPVRPTATHPDRTALGWDRFAELITGYGVPVYALGGLSASDLGQARTLGAQGIAAIRSAWR